VPNNAHAEATSRKNRVMDSGVEGKGKDRPAAAACLFGVFFHG
jgi:hypothetical protein